LRINQLSLKVLQEGLEEVREAAWARDSDAYSLGVGTLATDELLSVRGQNLIRIDLLEHLTHAF